MGSLFSTSDKRNQEPGFFALRCDPRHRVYVLGLDAAGKTTFAMKKKNEGTDEENKEPVTVATLQWDQVTTNICGRTVEIWALGGQTSIRKMWGRFVHKPEVIVYVIDLHDRQRWNDAVSELIQFLENDLIDPLKPYQPMCVGVPILMVLNKIDLVGEHTSVEVEARTLMQVIVGKFLKYYDAHREITRSEVICELASFRTGEGIAEVSNAIGYLLYKYHTGIFMQGVLTAPKGPGVTKGRSLIDAGFISYKLEQLDNQRKENSERRTGGQSVTELRSAGGEVAIV